MKQAVFFIIFTLAIFTISMAQKKDVLDGFKYTVVLPLVDENNRKEIWDI